MKEKLRILNPAFVISLLILILIYSANSTLGSFRAIYVTKELGATATAAGVVGMWWTYGSMVVRIFVGRISSKVGNQKLLTLGTIGYSVTLALSALTTNVTNFTIVVVLQAICHPFCYIAVNSLLAKATPKGQEGTGTYLFVGIPSAISGVASPWIANACIASKGGFDLMFIVCALFMLVAFALAIVLKVYTRKHVADAGSEAIVDISDDKVILDENGNLYKGIWKYFDKKALGPVFLQLVGLFAEMSVTMFVMLYATELGVPNYGALLFTAVSISGLFVTLVMGSVMDKLGMISVIIIGCVAGVSCYMILLFGSTSIASWVIAGILYGFSAGCTRPTFNAGMIKLVPKNRLDVATSNFALATSVGMGVAGVIIGKMIDSVGYSGVWIFSAVMYVITFALAAILFRKFLFAKKGEQK